LEALGRLVASWGVFWRSLDNREPFYFRFHFRSDFGLHFASISDPKAMQKSLENRPKSHAKIKKEKRLISMPLPSKVEENLMLKPKRRIFKNYAKT
jgi:hypothetical protein